MSEKTLEQYYAERDFGEGFQRAKAKVSAEARTNQARRDEKFYVEERAKVIPDPGSGYIIRSTMLDDQPFYTAVKAKLMIALDKGYNSHIASRNDGSFLVIATDKQALHIKPRRFRDKRTQVLDRKREDTKKLDEVFLRYLSQEGGPNLDGHSRDELERFARLAKRDPHWVASTLFRDKGSLGPQHVEATEKLGRYAELAAKAAETRAVGKIGLANKHETAMEIIYRGLPQFARW